MNQHYSLSNGSVRLTGEREDRMRRPFLTARWTNLVLANYRVPPELLLPHVPPGSELDAPDDEPGLHLLSLVAMRFADTHVYGLPVPTAQSFPEVNLRFYVRRGPRRACVFLREFVPVPLVVLGARLFYHQPYFLARLSHDVQVEGASISVQTHLQHRGRGGEIRLRARNDPATPPSDSQGHFLKEHYWGFDRSRSGESFRYRVYHPVWRTYPIEHAEVTMNPGALLGGAWDALEWDTRLHSILFAEGSAAAVYEKESLFAEEPYSLGNAPTADASIGRRSSAELPEPPEGRSA